jgi:hypothetical protein
MEALRSGNAATSNVDLLQEEKDALRCGDSASSSMDSCDMTVLSGESRMGLNPPLKDLLVMGDTL